MSFVTPFALMGVINLGYSLVTRRGGGAVPVSMAAGLVLAMLGKAAGNFLRRRTFLYGVIAVGSLLFFFSDLMLVFDWFIGRWSWTDHACMGTYYPALCLLALSMCLRTGEE